MKKIILFFIFALSLLLIFPNWNTTSVQAQVCGRENIGCFAIGSQSNCCSGYTCEASGAPVPGTRPGVCTVDNSVERGGAGQPCDTNGRCNSGLACSAANTCVNISNGNNSNSNTSSSSNSSSENSITCTTGGVDGIETAIGCIPYGDTNAFLGFILGWAIGIGGGIAFLLILVAGFQIMTSSGNPDRLKAGQELMTSAIAGLIMLIFSIFILKLIGVDILGLDKFGFPSL